MAGQRSLTGGASVARPADAVEASGEVQAAAIVEAGAAGAVIQVDCAEASSQAWRAEAREAVDAIQAGGAVGTWLHQAVVHVCFTVWPREADQAATCQLLRETVCILTETAILTWRPGDRTGNISS